MLLASAPQSYFMNQSPLANKCTMSYFVVLSSPFMPLLGLLVSYMTPLVSERRCPSIAV